MTEPIDQATKDLIEKEAAKRFPGYPLADERAGYVVGATVWAEKLKQKEKEVSLRESQQDVMAADTVKLMDQIEYQKKAAKKDYDRIKKLEFRLKQERNKVIDECINRFSHYPEFQRIQTTLELASLKDKSHE